MIPENKQIKKKLMMIEPNFVYKIKEEWVLQQ